MTNEPGLTADQIANQPAECWGCEKTIRFTEASFVLYKSIVMGIEMQHPSCEECLHDAIDEDDENEAERLARLEAEDAAVAAHLQFERLPPEQLAERLRRYADDIENEGRTHAPRCMRAAANILAPNVES